MTSRTNRICGPGSFRAGFLSTIFVVLAAPAMPAELPADLAAYCAATYGAGTQGGIDRRDNGPLCTERTNGGLGLLHHKVDPAAICASQHQTSRYRKEGGGLVCLTQDEPASGSKTVDLADYCRRNHGPSAIVSRRLTDGQPLCTVKGDGGLSQVHHLVDVGELCGGGDGSLRGDTLDCSGSGPAGGSAEQTGDGGGNPPPAGEGATAQSGARSGTQQRPGGAGGVRLYSRAELAELDLSDCGYLSVSTDMQENMANAARAYRDPNGRGGFGWEFGGVDTPCTAMGPGLKADLDEFCRWNNPTYDIPRALGLTTSNRPMCLGPDDERDEAWWSGTGLQLSAACMHAYPGGEEPFRSGELGIIVKYGGGALECFYYRQRPDGDPAEQPEVFVEVET